jgi:hypothetical protein
MNAGTTLDQPCHRRHVMGQVEELLATWRAGEAAALAAVRGTDARRDAEAAVEKARDAYHALVAAQADVARELAKSGL